MPVLSICNHKGGTGKTTSAIHLAAAYGLTGLRVLLVDLDPQGFLTRMLGQDEPQEAHSSLVLFDHERTMADVEVVPMPHFDLLPASYGMTRAARKLNKPTDVLWAKEFLQAGHDYDLVLLDTAAAMTVFSLNALVASDVVLIPVTPEYQPVVGAEQTYSTARLVKDKLNPKLLEPLFLLTQVDARKRDHQVLSDYVRRSFAERVMPQEIRTHASLAVATTGGRTVFDRDLSSRGAKDYAAAADTLRPFLFPDDSDARSILETLAARAEQERPAGQPAWVSLDGF